LQNYLKIEGKNKLLTRLIQPTQKAAQLISSVNSLKAIMGKSSNQEIEKYYFEMFRNDYPLPSGNVVYGDSPDVVIDGERKIGIEITNFYHKPGTDPESEQIQNSWRCKVISEAQI
jgi:hypothetical protein